MKQIYRECHRFDTEKRPAIIVEAWVSGENDEPYGMPSLIRVITENYWGDESPDSYWTVYHSQDKAMLIRKAVSILDERVAAFEECVINA